MKKTITILMFCVGIFFWIDIDHTHAETEIVAQEMIMVEQSTYVPIRSLMEYLGATVHWDPDTDQINIRLDETNIRFVLEDTKAIVNESEVPMPAAILHEERTMVPIRFVSENLGVNVLWNASTRTVSITKSDYDKIVFEFPKPKIIELGMNYLGKPYRFGASNRQTNAFDCSSFTQRVFSEIGTELPRTSRSQFLKGEPVSFSNLQVGDLLFFDTAGYGQISHVSIYAGNNEHIHATNDGVIKNEITSYWTHRYKGAKRVR